MINFAQNFATLTNFVLPELKVFFTTKQDDKSWSKRLEVNKKSSPRND